MPTLVPVTKGKSLKLAHTVLGLNLFPFPSEAAIKNEMVDPGSLKSPSAKGNDSHDLHWGRAWDRHPIPAHGPDPVPQDLCVLYW